jgi:hypothetical protein
MVEARTHAIGHRVISVSASGAGTSAARRPPGRWCRSGRVDRGLVGRGHDRIWFVGNGVLSRLHAEPITWSTRRVFVFEWLRQVQMRRAASGSCFMQSQTPHDSQSCRSTLVDLMNVTAPAGDRGTFEEHRCGDKARASETGPARFRAPTDEQARLDARRAVWQGITRLQEQSGRFALDKRQALIWGLRLLSAGKVL